MDLLEKYSKYPVPGHIKAEIVEYVGRYGKVKLIKKNGQLIITCDDRYALREIWRDDVASKYLGDWIDDTSIAVKAFYRGHVKQALIRIGYPVEDLAGYTDGERLTLRLREACRDDSAFRLRRYQS